VLGHQPGTLGRVLQAFSDRGINLTKIESRPIPGSPWQYRFYLDVEGHRASEPLAGILAAVQAMVAEFDVLGTYPRSEPTGPE
jgi:chorismate mutase/prephenate dehydratase